MTGSIAAGASLVVTSLPGSNHLDLGTHLAGDELAGLVRLSSGLGPDDSLSVWQR